MNLYHVGCGAFGGPKAPVEYYIADEDGTVVRRGFRFEDDAEAICDEMNANSDRQ